MKQIRFFLKLLLNAVLLLCVLLIALWFMLTQPIVPPAPLDSTITIDTARLEAHVRMLSEQLPPRNADPARLDVSAAYIFDAFERCGGQPQMQDFIVQGESYRNVALTFVGNKTETIVIGAHYDTLDGLPGADDNASGVAGLIELACLLARHPVAVTVELVAYTLEEPPHFASTDMGSYRHAQSLRQAGDEIALMISLEMIGYFDDSPGSQHYPLDFLRYLYPARGDFIAIVGRPQEMWQTRRVKRAMRSASTLAVYSLNAPPVIPGLAASDHSSYWQFDYPALMLTDTAYHRNFAYHTDEDTADRLDYKRMAQVVEGVYQVLTTW